MAKIAVRRVNEWDGPSMLKIYAPYTGTPCAPEAAPPALADYIRRIDKYTYGLGCLLCEIDSTPAGFCFLSEDREAPGDLFSVEFQLYVKAEYQRHGVGRALWTLMKDIMEMGNRRRVTVRPDPENAAAEGFFKAMGFRPDPGKDGGGGEAVLRYDLIPADPGAERPTKPYLIENLDYERARERAAGMVKI